MADRTSAAREIVTCRVTARLGVQARSSARSKSSRVNGPWHRISHFPWRRRDRPTASAVIGGSLKNVAQGGD